MLIPRLGRCLLPYAALISNLFTSLFSLFSLTPQGSFSFFVSFYILHNQPKKHRRQQTHEKNQRSRAAILAIGATFEGIQRDCRIQQDGSIRSSAFYSIIKPEWPQAKSKLITKLTHPTIEIVKD